MTGQAASDLQAGCALCDAPGGRVVYQDDRLRVVYAGEAAFPAFYRVVWNAHRPEFSDLSFSERMGCIDAVVRVEQWMRAHLAPTKVNVASLGNAVPHLHWHMVARFDWDSHFPGPVWAAAARGTDQERVASLAARLPALEADLIDRLQASAAAR